VAPKRFKPQRHAPRLDAFLPLGVCSSGASALLEAGEEAVSVVEDLGRGDGGEQPWLDHRRTWRAEPALLLVDHAVDERAEAVLVVVANLGRRPIGEPALDLCHDSSRCRRRADLRLWLIARSGRRFEQPGQQRWEAGRLLDGRAAVGRNREEQRLLRGLRFGEEVASAESGQRGARTSATMLATATHHFPSLFGRPTADTARWGVNRGQKFDLFC
jgi:hypothetical protein